jgi:hypothetical protein
MHWPQTPTSLLRWLAKDVWRKAGALLCIALLATLTTVVVAHVHHDTPGGTTDSHCQLCQLSHSPAVNPSQAAFAIYLAMTAAAVLLRRSLWLNRVAVRDITTRPPPRTR